MFYNARQLPDDLWLHPERYVPGTTFVHNGKLVVLRESPKKGDLVWGLPDIQIGIGSFYRFESRWHGGGFRYWLVREDRKLPVPPNPARFRAGAAALHQWLTEEGLL